MTKIHAHADVPAVSPSATRDNATPEDLASLRWSPEWTRLLTRALDGDKDAVRIWEYLAETGDLDAQHVVTTLRVLEVSR